MDGNYKSQCTKYTMYSIRTYTLQRIIETKCQGQTESQKSCKPPFRCKNKPTMAHRNLDKVTQLDIF